MTDLEKIIELVESKKDRILDASDRIHDFAEMAYEEVKSAAVLTEILREEGFEVREGLAGMPTCFTGTWENGGMTVGILGEYDALDMLSQVGGCTYKNPLKEGAPGHGCGHCALGTGALAAAVAIKDYLSENQLPGTVIYYGCPAEEGAGAKQFMARDGLFDCCDFVYTWHPAPVNEVSNDSSNAIMGANFSFRGVSAHAGGSPWAGRSALDAAELMSVGCNYLREHILDGERIHYAYADAGGTSPNVVPDYARVKYEVRSPKVRQVKELFERVVNVAKGAALMTETAMEYEITMAFSDSLNNSVLAEKASRAMQEIGAPEWTEEDFALAKAYLDSFDKLSREVIAEDLKGQFGAEAVPAIMEKPLHSEVIPYNPAVSKVLGTSTDVGDVTYAVPTCSVNVAACCLGCIGHTWQMAGQAGSVLAHKGLLTAAKVMALSAIRMMADPGAVEAAKKETLLRSGGRYECPLPDSVKPPVGVY